MVTPEVQVSTEPDRYIIVARSLSGRDAYRLAQQAVRMARALAPKLTGKGARDIYPISGAGFFGLAMPAHLWYNERGTKPRTMHELEGKVIPMWIDDPTGKEASNNPKAQRRVTASGKKQVLIFRRAAKRGEQRVVRRKIAGQWQTKFVNKHWPGAPGRIALREAKKPYTTPGRTAGAVAPQNIGVWWRHPGITPRMFANHAMTTVAQRRGIVPSRIYVAGPDWRGRM